MLRVIWALLNIDVAGLTDFDGRITALETRTDGLSQRISLIDRQANGGIAAAMAMSGAMIVPDSTMSLSFNLATYGGQRGFSTAFVGRLSEKVYFSGGIAGSSVKGTTGARVGFAIGF